MYRQDKKFTEKRALWPFLKRIFKYSLGYRKWFSIFVGSMVIVTLTDAAFPWLWKFFIDDAVTPGMKAVEQLGVDNIDFTPVWIFGGIFLGVGLLQNIGVWFMVKYTGYIQEFVMWDLRREMFTKLQLLQFSYFDKNSSGWLLTRISSDTDRVTEMLSWGFLEFVWGVMMIIASLTAMFFLKWELGLVVLMTLPLLFFVSVKIRMLILKYSRAARKVNSEITASYSENIHGVAVNKSTGQESAAGGRFNDLSTSMRKNSFKASYYTAMYTPLVIFIGSLATAVVIIWGGNMTQALPIDLTIGELAAFLGYTTMIFMPILDIARFYALAQGSLSAGERIFSLLDEPILISDRKDAKSPEQMKGKIEFKDVDFHYVEGKPVIDDLNLKIDAGQSIALVGATGEGKTTIANLVARFYEPTAGNIYIDDLDYMDMTQDSLRSRMGIVLQTPHLFSGTIRSNILFARPEASEDLVRNALEKIGASDLIERLDEEVGEGGEHLSEGERQMVSFARAIIADPAIFIMDEATSSVDTITEVRIQQGIQAVLENRTSLIIAHRLSTIRNCDRILVIEKGKIKEDGSHDELMKSKGKYYTLYTRQLRGELA